MAGGVSYNHYPWCIWPHYTGTLFPNAGWLALPLKYGTSLYKDLPPPPNRCSNLFIVKHTGLANGWFALWLECFLVNELTKCDRACECETLKTRILFWNSSLSRYSIFLRFWLVQGRVKPNKGSFILERKRTRKRFFFFDVCRHCCRCSINTQIGNNATG